MSRNQKYLFANVLSRFLEYPSLPGGNIDPISTCMRLLSVPECIMKDTKVNCLMHLSLSLSLLYHVIGLTIAPKGRRRRLVYQWTV